MKFLAKTLILTLLVSALVGMVPNMANAAIIAVLDAEEDGSSTLYDRSTDGDSIAGITGVFTTTENDFAFANSNDFWGDGTPGFLNANSGPGETDNASWTLSNLPLNTTFEVFVNWRKFGQALNATDAPYTVNGTNAGTRSHLAAVPADLTLDDDGPISINFSKLGDFSSSALGQIVVGLTPGNGFTNMDAVVIRSVAAPTSVPEPSSWALLLGGIGLIGCRRWRRKS